MDDIKRTYYFVSSAIPHEFNSFLDNMVWLPQKPCDYGSKYNVLLYRIKLFLQYRYLFSNAIVYAQDHLSFASQLMGKSPYILLEDAPGIFSAYMNTGFFILNRQMTLHEKIHCYVYWGRNWGNVLGTSPRCINRILTEEKDLSSDLIKGKPHEIVNLQKLWDKSDEEKKKFIKDIYGINDSVLGFGKTAETIFFSQPFVEDFGLTETEMCEFYKDMIEKYSSSGLVIKVHPRDKFNYEKYFSGVVVLRCVAPMQLLVLMGMNFKRAITSYSTAVSNMPKGTEIIMLGTQGNNKIENIIGYVGYSKIVK